MFRYGYEYSVQRQKDVLHSEKGPEWAFGGQTDICEVADAGPGFWVFARFAVVIGAAALGVALIMSTIHQA